MRNRGSGGRCIGCAFELLGGCAKVQEPPAKGDGAQSEPYPAKGEAGEDVCQPVHPEEHPRAGDANGKSDGSSGQNGVRPGGPAAAKNENERGKAGSGGDRVPGREGGAAESGQLIEGGASAVDRELDRSGYGELTTDSENEEADDGERPVVAAARDGAHDHGKGREHYSPAQLRERSQGSCGPGGGVPGAEPGGAEVEMREPDVVAHHEQEDPDSGGPEDDDGERRG